MKVVEHGSWFHCEINGVNYEAMYVERGWTYATLAIRYYETYVERKWILFGDKVERKRKVYITYDSREDMNLPDVTHKKSTYPAEKARRDVEAVMSRHRYNLKQLGLITNRV